MRACLRHACGRGPRAAERDHGTDRRARPRRRPLRVLLVPAHRPGADQAQHPPARDTPLTPVNKVRGYIDDELLSNTLFEGVNRVAARFPAAIPRINNLSSRALSAREFTDRNYAVFASPRRVRFREMEYAIPAEALPETLREIDGWLQRSDFRVAFPVEVRFAAADDVWLSTANGRATAYIAVHQYHRRDHSEYFNAVESIARAVDGRPHWGKLHSRTAADLQPTYAHFDEFRSVRDKYDPARVFDNAYLRQVLG
ncbi:D-arabinono-1,4-lactone oxidase family protein [Rhodococcus sp. MTM3W5.2]|nr:D-arabinono-1,4-lactone oxidase family protein [Rhodococcus sp. MTM3W5.2]